MSSSLLIAHSHYLLSGCRQESNISIFNRNQVHNESASVTDNFRNSDHEMPHVYDVRMKGIQNEIIISQEVFIIHINGLHHYKAKLSKLFSAYITFSVNSNVDSLGGFTNIQAWSMFGVNCSRSVPYAGFQVLKVVDLNRVDNVLPIKSQEKIHWG
jgi:hypothetical protein